MAETFDVLIVGGGMFGLTAAIELSSRGRRVGLIDPGPIPHPMAASTDISKVVRMAYGADELYTEMGEQSIAGWKRWNEAWGETLYHETGVTMFTHHEMQPGGFEHDSYHLLTARGHKLERLNADEIARRFPGWKAGSYVDGFFHAESGYAESGRVVEKLAQTAARIGVKLLPGQTFASLIENSGRVTGVNTREGSTFYGGETLIAAGTWTHALLPELAPYMHSTGHPVFHLMPPHPELFTPPNFAVFTADVSGTGWYGFPVNPRSGVVKVANHGIGQRLHPEFDARIVTPEDEANLRAMLADTFPDLAHAPIVYTRRCLYCDTLDENFWIDHHPEKQGLTVAAGDSGHGFKFAPVMGTTIADAVEGRPNAWLPRFRWREIKPEAYGQEASRHHADGQ
jgi:glycine/D-amino acid oxidase-like deaminating enzyme